MPENYKKEDRPSWDQIPEELIIKREPEPEQPLPPGLDQDVLDEILKRGAFKQPKKNQESHNVH